MALIVDIGNSRLTICQWEGAWQVSGLLKGKSDFGKITMPVLNDMFSFDRPECENERAELRKALHGFWNQHSDEEIVVVSTVPALTAIILEVKPQTIVLESLASLPFRHSIMDTKKTGPDRLCNIATAINAGLDSALVVDAGTATTFDLLKDGHFCGGIIAPGMAFSAKKLGQVASLLAPVPFAPCPLRVGTNTTSAMAAGGFHVGIQGVQGVIRGLLEEYGDMPVIITGGVGRYLSWDGALYDPHWTQRGAAVLAGLTALPGN